MSNVKLAIRVRPFTDKEFRSEKDRIQVVNVLDQNMVTITNMNVSASRAGDSRERIRRYHADYTFDSACSQTLPTYASQEKVFETIGRQVLSSIFQGSSACVLAYGQSATGKTHTMMGTESQPGLIPRICNALFENGPLHITVSFLEIYNERVHDLLAGEVQLTCHSLPRRKGNARKDLRVREHPSRGPYVQNLRRVSVHDVESLLSVVQEGSRRRHTASTRRNPASSRSHALLEITTPAATLHLADLAGSEKASWEGCGGGRQKEGANINKSLVALSNVISALVRGGGRGKYVPYRDSALTWLLKDCFTGRGSTYIIATVSPSIGCHGESASTLRWAERARRLPARRCGPPAAPLRAAQAQLGQLLAELARHHIRYEPETGKIAYDEDHWGLQVNKSVLGAPACEITDINIGNIMSISYPKSDTHNSESTPSSVASGSSDVINTMDKSLDISNEISKEVDKLFGPALERTGSSSDLKVIAPIKNSKRQYKSQEVLPIDKTLQVGQSLVLSDAAHSLSEANIDETQSTDDDKITTVPIVYDSNQRAEIVASVTDRLYSKLKKKETAGTKESVVDKKVIQPLSELRICTNARQRLVELSQKAIRNKRRIGIPVHTQTRKNVIRVKDQEIDVQNDLVSYGINKKRAFVQYRDVSTETTPVTPRYKEASVGPSYGSLHVCDKSTITENTRKLRKNCVVMTDIVKKIDHSTQTPVPPPLRRKKRSTIFTRLMKRIENSRNNVEESSAPPIININISPSYPANSDSSEDERDKCVPVKKSNKDAKSISTPDLLTNHSNIDKNKKKKEKKKEEDHSASTDLDKTTDDTDESILLLDDRDVPQLNIKSNDDFPEQEENVLPRVVVTPSSTLDHSEIKNMILGRNADLYPYNIHLSPSKPRDDTRKLIRFKEIDITPAECCNYRWDNNNDNEFVHNKIDYSHDTAFNDKDSRESLYSDCSSSGKIESDSYSWRKARPTKYQSTNNSMKRNHLAVPKSNTKYKIARAKLYKQFLGLEKHDNDDKQFLKCSPPKDVATSDIPDEYRIGSKDAFRQRRQFFENKFNRGYYGQGDNFGNIERKIITSCNKLELATDRYQEYLNNYRENKFEADRKAHTRTPTEYLQHLVQLRREVIQANSHRTESFV